MVDPGVMARFLILPGTRNAVRELRTTCRLGDPSGILESLQILVTYVVQSFSAKCTVPNVTGYKRTKRIEACYEFGSKVPTIKIDPMKRDGSLAGFDLLVEDLAHEVCHHIDLYVFGFVDSYHTPSFYMRCTILAERLKGLV